MAGRPGRALGPPWSFRSAPDRSLWPQVRLSRDGTVAGYGMLAAEELEEGEVLFTIPRTALLSQHTTSIHALLQEGKCKLLASLESAVPCKGVNGSMVKPRERS